MSKTLKKSVKKKDKISVAKKGINASFMLYFLEYITIGIGIIKNKSRFQDLTPHNLGLKNIFEKLLI